jgi:glycosyltransferase involved in cell wall biosynthesis
MARPVRILHVGPDPTRPGGMASVIRTLMSSSLADRYAMDALPTWRWEPSRRRHLLFPWALTRLVLWCLRPGPRVAHVHAAVRGSIYRKAVVVAVVRALGRPAILHMHAGAGDVAAFDARLGRLRRVLLGSALGLASRVISVSAAGAEEVERRFGVQGVLVVPNVAPVVRESAARGAGDAPVVLYLGGFEDRAKGGALLVDALPALLSADRRVHVELAGPGAPPPALRDLIALEPRVRWRGWLDRDQLAAAYSTADMVVLPSLSEGMPVALLEAMAYGRAIVATRVGGIPEVLTDGVDARLVDPGDPSALAAALASLAGNEGARRRLGSLVRSRAAELSEGQICAPLAQLYDQLAGTMAPADV